MTKLKMNLPEKSEILKALQRNNWSLGNDALYNLCRDNPSHRDAASIVSKFWVIGRVYSASVDRRRTSKEKPLAESENFYEHRLVPTVQKADFDGQFEKLKSETIVTESNLEDVIRVHYYVTKTLQTITHQWKISLVSKYLHFHFPDLFFIYDSYAHEALGQYVPNWSSRRLQTQYENTKYYHKFCLGLITLRDNIAAEYEYSLSPRELDRLLLRQ